MICYGRQLFVFVNLIPRYFFHFFTATKAQNFFYWSQVKSSWNTLLLHMQFAEIWLNKQKENVCYSADPVLWPTQSLSSEGSLSKSYQLFVDQFFIRIFIFFTSILVGLLEHTSPSHTTYTCVACIQLIKIRTKGTLILLNIICELLEREQ